MSFRNINEDIFIQLNNNNKKKRKSKTMVLLLSFTDSIPSELMRIKVLFICWWW